MAELEMRETFPFEKFPQEVREALLPIVRSYMIGNDTGRFTIKEVTFEIEFRSDEDDDAAQSSDQVRQRPWGLSENVRILPRD